MKAPHPAGPLRGLIGSTARGYPRQVHFVHALWAVSSYRAHQEAARGHSGTALECFFGSYFCHAFGSSSVMNMLLGMPLSLFTGRDTLPFFIGAWLLVHFAPYDCVHEALCARRSPARYAAVCLEAIDAFTTLTGKTEQVQRLHPGASFLAPMLAGVASTQCGAILRALEARGRGVSIAETPMPWRDSNAGLRRACAFVTLFVGWQQLLRRNHAPRAVAAEIPRYYLCLTYIGLALAEETTGKPLDPFEWPLQVLGGLFEKLRVLLSLGRQDELRHIESRRGLFRAPSGSLRS